MHHCLEIAEIRQLICEETWTSFKEWPQTSSSPRSPRADLLSLALTCRGFKEPALDRLYYELDDLLPLVMCLPCDVWSYEPIRGSHGRVLKLRRALQISDASIIQKYNSRVRSVLIYDSDIDRMTVDVLQSLRFLFPDGLLPNLTHLKFAEYTNSYFQYLPMFLSPRVICMRLRLATLNARVGSLLSSLPPRFLSGSNPSLRNLEVIFPSEGEFTHLSGLLSSLQTWHNLQRLYVSVADVDVFLRVSRLPYLHTLILQDFKGQPSDRDQESLHDPTHLFPALRLFEVETTLAIGCKLLPFLQRSKLECLSIYRNSEITPNDTGTKALMDFVKCVGDICDPFCLKALRIRARKSRYAKFSNILHPLRDFSMLKSFKLCLQKSPELSSEHVVWIGESWPNLETLSITSSEAVDYPSTVLSIFASLASQCPKLHRLKLEVDACYFTDRAAIFMRLTQADGFRNSVSSLKYLDVSTSPIEGKELVAAFLSEIFPDLRCIRSSVTNKTYNSRWQKIGQLLLPMLSMTKKRERFLLDETKGSTMTASSKRDWATDDLSRLEYYWDPMVEGDGSDGDDEIDLDGGESTDDDTIEIRH